MFVTYTKQYNNYFKHSIIKISEKMVNPIRIFEKHPKFSWFIVILIAEAIFFVSSLTFPPGQVSFGWKSLVYHFSAFFFFGFFLIISIIKGNKKNIFLLIFLSALFAIIYAISDEFHQLFVPGRACSLSDILVDSAGILSASFLYILSLKFRKK